MKRFSRCTVLVATAFLVACTQEDQEPVEAAAQAIYIERQLPLLWHFAAGEWNIDPYDGSASEASPPGPLPTLRAISTEIIGLPHKAQVHRLKVYIDPADGHTALPDNMPSAGLWQYDRLGNIVQAFPSAPPLAAPLTAADYDQPHDIIQEEQAPFWIDATLRTAVVVECEFGQNALAGMMIKGVSIVLE